MKKYWLFDDIYIEWVDEEWEENNHVYELLSNHAYWLNIFLWDVSSKLDPDWWNEPYNEEKDLKITLDYLEPLLKNGKIEANINKIFKSVEDANLFSDYIKTKWAREQIIKKIQNKEDNKFLSIYYDYSKEEIGSFKEDVYNILFNFCKTEEERWFFEEEHIMFSLPEWEGLYS